MIIEWPEGLQPSSDTWTLNSNNRAFTSSLSNSQQVVSYPGEFWSAELNFDNLTRCNHDKRILSSLTGKMRGMLNRVKVPNFTAENNRELGTVSLNAPVVALAMAIQVKGLTDDFQAGDFITVSDMMFEIVEDTQHVGGVANVLLNKSVRFGVPVDTPVEYKRPYCVMRKTDDKQAFRNMQVVSSSSVSLREAF